jgi:hypothetical protein
LSKASILPVAVLALAVGASVAVADALPGVKTAHDRAAWRLILSWPSGCEQSWRLTHAIGAGVDLESAGSSGQLVTVSCYLGAYQGDAVLYLITPSDKAIGPLVLQIYRDPGNGHPRLTRQTEILGILGFSHATGTLAVFDEFRGLGDCGIYSRYRLDGNHFLLIEARAKTACDGKPPFAPQSWPKLPIPKGA